MLHYVENRIYRELFPNGRRIENEIFWKYNPEIDIKTLDYSLVDSFDIYVFPEIEEYTYTISKLLSKQYPYKKQYCLDEKIQYFPELMDKVIYMDDLALTNGKILDGEQCLWTTSDGVNHSTITVDRFPIDYLANIYNSINVLYSIFWCSIVECFGNKNKSSTIYVYDCCAGAAGLVDYIKFTYLNYILAKQYNWKFVVDLSHKPNQYLMSESENMWDYFFEPLSDMSLDEVYESASVIRCSVNSIDLGDLKINPHLRNLLPHVANAMKNVKFNRDTKSRIEELMPEVLRKDNGVLGVILRGTDYRAEANRAVGRSVKVAGLDKMIAKCKFIMDLYGYQYIFLATEDLEYFEKIKKEFGERCICIDQKRGYHDYRLGYRSCADVLEIENGKDFGRRYLAIIYSLSKCRSLLSNMMNGTTRAAKSLNNLQYEHFEIVNP